MKQLAFLTFTLSFLFIFNTGSAQASSELETWCLAEGQSWDSGSATCTITGVVNLNQTLQVGSTETLIVDASGELATYFLLTIDGNLIVNGSLSLLDTLYINAYVTNDGTIDIQDFGEIINEGILLNRNELSNVGRFSNNGEIINEGTLGNYPFDSFVNYSRITNTGLFINDNNFDNDGRFINIGTIMNGSIFNNLDILNNYCPGQYSGPLPTGNPINQFEACSYMPALP